MEPEKGTTAEVGKDVSGDGKGAATHLYLRGVVIPSVPTIDSPTERMSSSPRTALCSQAKTRWPPSRCVKSDPRRLPQYCPLSSPRGEILPGLPP